MPASYTAAKWRLPLCLMPALQASCNEISQESPIILSALLNAAAVVAGIDHSTIMRFPHAAKKFRMP